MGDGMFAGRLGSGDTAATLDALALELRALRESNGVSYREIAARITRRREQDGTPPATARVAHSTVSDVFRLGRARINADLVVEIVLALGVDEEDARGWRERCIRAMSTLRQSPDAAGIDPAPVSGTRPLRSSAGTITLVLAGAVLLNATGEFLNPLIGNVLFLDMIGTAIAAILLGPWWAALAGVIFLIVELLKGDVGHALFAVTMVTSGLIWGYGVQRFELGRTLPRFLGLSAVVAVATTLIAVPVTVFYFGGTAGRGIDGFIAWATTAGADVWAALGASNLTISLVDKILTGAVAFFAAPYVSRVLDERPDAVGSRNL
ncbi:hypothetical protein [Microbacterium caowuchunii]|uniref:ECF transporter S component n=1 Tax=Microbacterium caowuchunii TaxID=2614638 RepID=A0A5N0THN8_9MICO|nr:hypothetical protein [Microbacterium caowuchunii]KAA9134512.1 hypothetical protein F6B40_07060 [Microbacterium caowuchunii]